MSRTRQRGLTDRRRTSTRPPPSEEDDESNRPPPSVERIASSAAAEDRDRDGGNDAYYCYSRKLDSEWDSDTVEEEEEEEEERRQNSKWDDDDTEVEEEDELEDTRRDSEGGRDSERDGVDTEEDEEDEEEEEEEEEERRQNSEWDDDDTEVEEDDELEDARRDSEGGRDSEGDGDHTEEDEEEDEDEDEEEEERRQNSGGDRDSERDGDDTEEDEEDEDEDDDEEEEEKEKEERRQNSEWDDDDTEVDEEDELEDARRDSEGCRDTEGNDEDERGEEEEEEEEESTMMMMASKRGTVTWRSVPPSSSDQRSSGSSSSISSSTSGRRWRPATTIPTSSTPTPTPTPGPTELARRAVSGGESTASAFLAYFDDRLEDRVIAATNLEASRRAAARRAIDGWRPMGRAEFRAYVGLLILAGVYRSRGEACESLWHAETGRSVFRATMPLKTFRAYSAALRFDDRDTREARRLACGGDKLAPVREVWDAWSERLPLLYEPGPEVTVDERLVPFKGRCPFKQYMPSKPARYGIKLWVACDAKSSYAWKMRVYTGKRDKRGPPEKNLASKVVLDLTEGLGPGRNVTFDNFFTSYELARALYLRRGLTSLGTVRANRAEIPARLLEVKGRRVTSSRFAFASPPEPPAVAMVSYLAKRNKNVLILTTAERHVRAPGLSGRADGKPLAVLHYNSTKGGVDNLDKLLGTYSCRRRTARWPLALFHNMVDVSAYNAFVLWRELNPAWMTGKLHRRRLFLERLGKELVAPLAAAGGGRREKEKQKTAGRRARRDVGGGGGGGGTAAPGPPRPPPRQRGSVSSEEAAEGDDENETESPESKKRKRCRVCPRSRDAKTRTRCRGCHVHVCGRCAMTYCPKCAAVL